MWKNRLKLVDCFERHVVPFETISLKVKTLSHYHKS